MRRAASAVPTCIYAATKGQTWFEVGETIRYELTGGLGTGVTAKDVFLHIAQTFGDHSEQNVEYGGPALTASASMRGAHSPQWAPS